MMRLSSVKLSILECAHVYESKLCPCIIALSSSPNGSGMHIDIQDIYLYTIEIPIKFYSNLLTCSLK